MGRSRSGFLQQGETVKKMHEEGYTIPEIADALGVGIGSVYNSFTIMGIGRKKPTIDEENIVYTDNSVVLEKVVINGKRYTDVTPLFSPR